MANESFPEKVRFKCRPEVGKSEPREYMREEKMASASAKIIVYLNCSRNSKEARVAGVNKVKSSGK